MIGTERSKPPCSRPVSGIIWPATAHDMNDITRPTPKMIAGTRTVRRFEAIRQATIEAASVNTRDENRDNHIRTNDFFGVEEHPTWTFVSTGLSKKGSDYALDGNLTIKGVTKPVTLALEVLGVTKDPWGNTKAGFSANTKVNRKDFGIEWNAPLEAGGFLVGDEVTLNLEIQAALQA